MKLTDAACRAAKPALKQYKLTDGASLYLLVKPTGGKCWQMRYSYLGKEKTYSIGLYPLVSLAEARDARTLAKKALQAGIDPTEAKREEKQKAIRKAGNTFKATALEWHETQKGRWTEQHAQNVLHRLERDVFPHIGNRPIEGIKAPDLLDLLRKIEKRGALDIAGRTRQICGQVFRYGIQIGRCENNPAESLRGALKPRKTTHYPGAENNIAIVTPDLNFPNGMPNLATQEGQERLKPLLDDVNVIIVDNISTLASGGKENEAESWLPLQAWALKVRAMGKSVIFIHHANKDGGQRGTSKKEDVMDTVIKLAHPADYDPTQGARFEVTYDKSRNIMGADTEGFEAHFTKNGWTFKSLADIRLQQVHELKALDPRISVREISEALDIPKSTVHRMLKQVPPP